MTEAGGADRGEKGHPLFSATKQIGFVLRSSENAALTWLQANQVLRLLRDRSDGGLDGRIAEKHRGKLVQAGFLSDIELVDSGDVAGDDHLGDRGHIYKSRAFRARYGAFVVWIVAAYTVCVRLPSPYPGDDPKSIQSKFWYSVVIEPSGALDLNTKAVQDDLQTLCDRLEGLAEAALDATLEFYQEAISQANSEIGTISRNAAYRISDLCVQVADPAFRAAVAAIGKGEETIGKAGTPSTDLLATLAKQPHLLADWKMDGAIRKRSFRQEDTRAAWGLYIETTRYDPQLSEGFEQRAVGVTEWTEPARPLGSNDNDGWRNRACHSLSNARVTEAVRRI